MLFSYKIYFYGNFEPIVVDAINERKAIDLVLKNHNMKLHNIKYIEKL